MKNLIKIVAAAALAVVLTQSAQAVPITGTIGFAGDLIGDQNVAANVTQVVSWTTGNPLNDNKITAHTGTFASLSPSATVVFHAPWSLNSGAIAGFWIITDGVNNYTFNLLNSVVVGTTLFNGQTSIIVALAGTVTSNVAGLSPTAWSGQISIQDPVLGGTPGHFEFSDSISFFSVPDGGTTVLLLGSALSGLALIRRKLAA